MPLKLSRRTWIIVSSALAIAIAVALAVLQPWLVFVNTEVNETIPQAVPPASVTAPAGQTPGPAASPDAPRGPVLVATGSFVSHEHTTTGRAAIHRLPNGNHQLVIEGLSTTTGPDVKVWLSAGPVVEGKDGWYTAGQHQSLDLGALKGNRGNQVYDLPPGANPAQWPTLDLWCKSFGVSFGAAALTPVA